MADLEPRPSLGELIQEAARRIGACGTIAVVLPDAPGIAALGSAVALALGLRAIGKTVTLFAPPQSAHAPWRLSDGRDEPLREFIISFDLTRSPIKELKYERAENRLDIILSPTGGQIRREDVELRYGPLRYELVVTVGVTHAEAASTNLQRVPELLYEKPILNIDAGAANTRYGELDLVADAAPAGPTIPELIHEILEALRAPPGEPERATALLTALGAATKHFHSRMTSAGAFLLAGELMRRGADTAIVSRHLAAGRTLAGEQLAGRAVARSRFEDGVGTLWAFLTPDDFAKTGATSRDISVVTARLAEAIPEARFTVLLWQESAGAAVACFAAAPEEADRQRLRAAGINWEHAAIGSPLTFGSFREAEARLSQLLRGNDAI